MVKTTIAEVDHALAELSTQVQAQIDDVTAVLEDKLTATVDADGATAIHTLKAGVRVNGTFYNAGMSIAVLAETGKPVITRIGFNANQFVLMSGSGDTQYSPFAVVNGQVFISDAFIQDGSINNAKIGNYIQSQSFGTSGGWRISKPDNNMIFTDENNVVRFKAGNYLERVWMADIRRFGENGSRPYRYHVPLAWFI